MARPLCLYAFAVAAVMVGLGYAASTSNSVTAVNTGDMIYITATNFSAPSEIGVYSPLPVSFNITNVGSLATGNITALLYSPEPDPFNGALSLAPLAPGQSELVLAYLYNATTATGGHTMYVVPEYQRNGSLYVQSGAVSRYTVLGTDFAGSIPEPGAANSIPGIRITSVPLVSYMLDGTSLLSQVGFSYNGTAGVDVSMSTSSALSKILTFSSSSLYMSQGQGLASSMLFNPGTQPYETTYLVPLNITGLQSGTRKSMGTYMQFTVLNNTEGATAVSEEVTLQNDSSSATGVLDVHSPSGHYLYNSGLELMIPEAAAGNVSDISAYGAPANISKSGGWYDIRWSTGDIQSGQNVYLYYSVDRLAGAVPLADSELLFYSTTRPNPQRIFSVYSTSIPTLYTDSAGQLEVKMLYTGTNTGTAVLYLPSLPGISVRNSTQVVRVSPNEQLEDYFGMTSGNFTGTVILKLYVTEDGINSTYYLPVQVLQNPNAQLAAISGYAYEFKYIAFAIILALIVALVVYSRMKRKRPREYNEGKAKELKLIRWRMNTGR